MPLARSLPAPGRGSSASLASCPQSHRQGGPCWPSKAQEQSPLVQLLRHSPAQTESSLEPPGHSAGQKSSLNASSLPTGRQGLRPQREEMWLKASLMPSASEGQRFAPSPCSRVLVSNPHTVSDDHPWRSCSNGFSLSQWVCACSCLPGTIQPALGCSTLAQEGQGKEDIYCPGLPGSRADSCSCGHHQ